MEQKLLKAKKTKIAPKKDAVAETSIVLVGTYKEKQLAWIKKNGIYNYPVKDGDELTDEACCKVKELWLYADVKSTRHAFAAEFMSKMSRDEFVAAYPTYAKLGKSKNKAYYVFRTTSLDYGPAADGQIVVARAADFGGRSAKVKKAVEQFKADGEFAPLSAYLPSDLAKVPRQQLRVCDSGVQLDFIQIMYPERTFPSVEPLRYIAGAITRHPRNEVAHPQTQDGAPFRLGEFFCGPGGLACGAMSATIENPLFKIEHAWANDYDQQTCDNMKAAA